MQAWGIGVLDQLLWSEPIEPNEAEDIRRAAEQHANEAVRERAEFIRSFFRARAEDNAQRSPNEG
jgi:hypothetical protein